MGQVITSAEMRNVVDSNLKSYIAQTTTSYARLFGKTPSFVTYYTYDPYHSMVDVNLGGAIQIVGQESSIRFNLINDFPLYGVTEADVTAAYEETQGIVQNGVRGEAFILPGTIQPNENDLFIIDYLESKLVFRVVTCSPDRVEGKAFYKVEYILEPYDWHQLQRQTTKNYTFELSTMGTGANPIIEQDTQILLREMDVLVEFHAETYWRAFYDRSSGTVLLRNGFSKAVHDRSVALFIKRNSLLGGVGYMKSRTVQPPEYADRGRFEDNVYPRTIYSCAERGGYTNGGELPLGQITMVCATPVSPASAFYGEFCISGYNEVIPANIGEYIIGCNDFIERLEARNFTLTTPLVSLALRCLRSDGFSNDSIPDAIREFNILLNDSSLLDLREDQFWLMPLILLRAKRFTTEARRREAIGA